MTSNQLKTKIQKTLDEIPESALEELLKYINGVKGCTRSEIEMSRNLSRILKEDRKLLEKLAQ